MSVRYNHSLHLWSYDDVVLETVLGKSGVMSCGSVMSKVGNVSCSRGIFPSTHIIIPNVFLHSMTTSNMCVCAVHVWVQSTHGHVAPSESQRL